MRTDGGVATSAAVGVRTVAVGSSATRADHPNDQSAHKHPTTQTQTTHARARVRARTVVVGGPMYSVVVVGAQISQPSHEPHCWVSIAHVACGHGLMANNNGAPLVTQAEPKGKAAG